MWYWIDTRFACAGIEINTNGVCITAAPIFRWMLGKHISDIEKWKSVVSIKRICVEGGGVADDLGL